MKNKSSLYNLTYPELKEMTPNLAILPWGATEAHNQHMPYCADVFEAEEVSLRASRIANSNGAASIVYPAIPFGNNAAHLDQFCTIHLNTSTALAILKDVCFSLKKQGIEKLLIVNSHGGNNFKPLIRDLQLEFEVLIVLSDLFLMIPETVNELFTEAGDHAGELETSFYEALINEEIDLSIAGDGKRINFEIKNLNKPGIWTPRPWKKSHPDLGSGNPKLANLQKGKLYTAKLITELSSVIFELSNAEKGKLPYI